jgi:hypothetical protein
MVDPQVTKKVSMLEFFIHDLDELGPVLGNHEVMVFLTIRRIIALTTSGKYSD